MRNRYGDEYWFEEQSKNIFTIEGNLNHWRYGGKEGTNGIDENDLGFVDPSGGPFIDCGGVVFITNTQKKRVKKIWTQNGKIYIEVRRWTKCELK